MGNGADMTGMTGMDNGPDMTATAHKPVENGPDMTATAHKPVENGPDMTGMTGTMPAGMDNGADMTATAHKPVENGPDMTATAHTASTINGFEGTNGGASPVDTTATGATAWKNVDP